jgi:hypothetical protein
MLLSLLLTSCSTIIMLLSLLPPPCSPPLCTRPLQHLDPGGYSFLARLHAGTW